MPLGYGLQVASLMLQRSFQTLLLIVPPYVPCVMTTYINALHADRSREKFYRILLPLSVAFIAFILAAATTSSAARYFAKMLMSEAARCLVQQLRELPQLNLSTALATLLRLL